jgi:hypothetical protein
MRWHPDRQRAEGGDAERAAFRMQEINAAWTVLRNPAGRAAYDAELAAATDPPRPGGRAVGGPPPAVPARAATPAPSPVPWGCLGVAVVCIVLALIVTAYAATNRVERPDIDVEVREPYAPGSCVQLPGGAAGGTRVTVVEVPCDGAHDAVVRERTTFPRPCPSGTTAVVLSDGATQLCLLAA